jgi:hypothetical protein
VIGEKLAGRYELLRELGRGGMGIVYLAHDPVLARDVAIKVLRREVMSPEAEERFQREARIVAQMDHPGIVAIYDFHNYEGGLFFVMPLVRGDSLRVHLTNRQLSVAERLELCAQVAEALDYSAEAGVVHRDIKPENVMVLGKEGGSLRAKVMDFGIALASADSRMTAGGEVFGTPAYLAPEQLAGGELDGRSDLYSLGVILYECLTGQPPFYGEFRSVLYRIVHEPPDRRPLDAVTDPETARLVLSCLAKDQAQRPLRAGEIASALRAGLRAAEGMAMDTPARLAMVTSAALGVASAIIGRERELGELGGRLDQVAGRECHFVLVGGEPGMGKTALLTEVGRRAAQRGALVLHGRFVERRDTSFPYQGFGEAIHEAARPRPGSPTGSAADLAGLARELITLFPMLDAVLAAAGAGAATAAPGERGRGSVFELLAKAFTAISRGRPLVLLFEDLHDADVSLAALQYLFRRMGASPTLIIGAHRTVDGAPTEPLQKMLRSLRDDQRFAPLMLGPLSGDEHSRLLSAQVGGELPSGLAQRIYDVGEGNPLFALEIVRSLLDAGHLSRDATGALSLTVDEQAVFAALPDNVQEVIERRLEKLTAGERALLSLASVLGQTFEVRDLEGLVDEISDLEPLVEGLLKKRLLEESRVARGERLAVASPLVREQLYSSLPQRRRRTLHRRHAEALERRGVARAAAAPALFLHFSRGGVPAKALTYALAAARSALDASVPEDAARYARAALEITKDAEWSGGRQAEGEAELFTAIAEARLGHAGEALRAAERADAAFAAVNVVERRIVASLLAAETAWNDRRLDKAMRWVESGAALARESGDDARLRRFLQIEEKIAEQRGGHLRAEECRNEAALLETTAMQPSEVPQAPSAVPVDLLVAEAELRSAEEALSLTRQDKGGAPLEEARQLLRLAELAQRMGRYAEGLERALAGEHLAAAHDAPLAARLSARAAALCEALGRFEDAGRWSDKAQDQLGEAWGSGSERETEALVLEARGRSLLAAAEPAAAVAACEDALLRFTEEEPIPRAAALARLALMRLAAGRFAEARDAAAEAAALAARSGDNVGAGLACHARASLLLAQGSWMEASEEASRGLERASESGEIRLLNQLRLDRGWAQLRLARVNRAEEEFLRVVRDADRSGALPEMIDAQVGLATANRLRGRFLPAEVAASIALQLAEQCRDEAALAAAKLALGELYVATGQRADARALLLDALAIEDHLANPFRRFAVIHAMIRLDLASGVFEAALRRAEALLAEADRSGESYHRGAAALAAAEARVGLRDFDGAERATLDALKHARVAGAPRLAAACHDLLTRACQSRGDTERALRHATAGVEICRSLGPAAGEQGHANLRLARVHYQRREAARVRAAGDAALLALQGADDVVALAEGHCAVALVLARDDPQHALALLRQGRSLARSGDAPVCEARALGLIGDLSWRLGRLNEAVEVLREESATLELAGHAAGMAMNRLRLAWSYEAFGDLRQAKSLLDVEGVPGADDVARARLLVLRGRVRLMLGEFAGAAEDLRAAAALAERAESPRELAAACRERAEGALLLGDLSLATAEMTRARQVVVPSSEPPETHFGCLVEEALKLTGARLALASGRPSEARRLALEALEAYRVHSSPIEQAEAALLAAAAKAHTGDASAVDELDVVREKASGLSLSALQADCLLTLARARGSLEIAREGYGLALALPSPPRVAMLARLISRLEAAAGRTREAQWAGKVADRALADLASHLPEAARDRALAGWDKMATLLGAR